jgi:hypothetical protein
MSIYNTQSFIEKAKSIHLNLYDYSNAVYKSSQSPLEIICLIHGSFWQRPSKHWRGQGCRKCANSKKNDNMRKSTEQFIIDSKAIFGDKFLYTNTIYTGRRKHLIITCKEHGDFEVEPRKHFEKDGGCRGCSNNKSKSEQRDDLKTFINKAVLIHGELHLYNKAVYINSKTKIEITCRKHGSFWQRPGSHLDGVGCPKCKSSRGEDSIRKYLQKHRVAFAEQVKFEGCRSKLLLPFDFGLYQNEKLLGLVEYQGEHHYFAVPYFGGEKAFVQTEYRDRLKVDYCNKNNIPLLCISYIKFNEVDFQLENFISKIK